MATYTYGSNVATQSVSPTVARFSEAGANDTGDSRALSGYLLNSATIAGSGSADTIVGTSAKDLVLWDENTAYAAYWGSSRYGWGSPVEVFSVGSGDDVVSLVTASGGAVYSTSVTIYGGDGADALWSGSGNDSLYGGAHSDSISGAAGNDKLYGGDAVDTLFGGSGADTAYGDASNDTIQGDAGIDLLFGGAGDDDVYGDNVFGGVSGADTLYGDAGDDSLFGGDSNDVLVFDQDYTLTGGSSGVMLWDGVSSGDALFFAAGAATWSWSKDQFFGGYSTWDVGTDTLVLDSTNDVFVLDTRDIIVNGVAQSASASRINYVELVLAGAGADIVALTSWGDQRYALAVTIAGEAGSDVLVGGDGADTIIGGVRSGGAADASVDIIAAGRGHDVVWGDNEGDAQGSTGGGDTLFGNDGADTMYGGAGEDLMFGGNVDGTNDDNRDILYGGQGGDEIYDLNNVSLMSGDVGDDVLQVTMSWGSGTLWGGAGNDEIWATGQYDMLSVDGGTGDDWIVLGYSTTNNTKDVVFGGSDSGADVIATFGGDDTIDAGSGNDAVWGGSGADTIYGGAGVDFLYGGEGANTIDGGAGADWYYVARGDGATRILDNDTRENNVVVFGTFDTSGNAMFVSGSGVNETPNNGAGTKLVAGAVLGSNANGEVDLSISSGVATLTIYTNNSPQTVTFDTNEVLTVTLYNHDAPAGFGQELFQWNGSTYAFAGYS